MESDRVPVTPVTPGVMKPNGNGSHQVGKDWDFFHHAPRISSYGRPVLIACVLHGSHRLVGCPQDPAP